MTYGRVIYKSAFRNKRRTALTVLSIAFSLFLLCTLQTVITEFDRYSKPSETDVRLVVRRATSITEALPLSYYEKLKRIPNVDKVTIMSWHGGYYRDEKFMFASFATDPETFFQVFSEATISLEHLLKFQREKSACIVGKKLAEQFGWKLGDQITLPSKIFPEDMDFTIRGIYTGIDETWFIMRQDYFRDVQGFDWIGLYFLRANRPENVSSIMKQVDALFKNAAFETKTETEKQFSLDFMNMLGNIRKLITSISAVVIFTILLVCATTMSMSIREQIREIAVLKTLGFQKETIYLLILAESAAITLLGGGLGCFGAYYFYRSIDIASLTMNYFTTFEVLPLTIFKGIGISLLMGLLSAWFPAYNAIKMPVTQGLKHIG
jgi:putative ABC transport system permease protein